MGKRQSFDGAMLIQLEKMLMSRDKNGQTVQNMADHFKVSTSTIHNARNALIKKGKKIPNIQGKRPIPADKIGKATHSTKAITGALPQGDYDLQKENNAPKKQISGGTNILINDIPIQIDGTPDHLLVTPTHVLITYGKNTIKITF